jgi:arsenate reductase
MAVITIWHNPRCSKSRQTLALLTDKGFKPVVVEYLKTPPSAIEIRNVIEKLALSAHDVIRSKEAIYKTLNLSPDIEPEALISAMVDNPVLIERPIVITDTSAAIGRPPEAVLKILPNA